MATPTDLCITVSAQAASVNSGRGALYSITVSAKGGEADGVTAQISSSAAPAPTFTVCGNGAGTQTCTLGTIPSGQSTQLQAEIAIPGSAPTGDTFTLSAAATGTATGGTKTGSASSSATVSAVAPPPATHTSSPPATQHHHSGSGHHHSGSGTGSHSGSGNGNGNGTNGSAGTTGNTNPFAGLPPLNTLGGSGPLGSMGSTGSSNPGGLFPTINPSSGPTTGTNSSTQNKPQRPYKATTVADVLPLNPSQLSTQVAGLVVLAIGIILVFARVSLRRPKGSQSKS